MSSGDIGSFDFWGSGWVSLEDRWGITGRMLQQKARNVYLSPGKEHITLPWFDDKGTPLWSRHVLNRDTQGDIIEKYVNSLNESGWLLGQRGEIMYVPGEIHSTESGKVWTPYLTVCGAHLIDTFDIAIKRFEEHLHFNITLNHGVPH